MCIRDRDAAAQWNSGAPPDDPNRYNRPPEYDYSRGYNRPPGYNTYPGWQNRKSEPARPLDDPYPTTPIPSGLNPTIQRYITLQRQAGRLAANESSAWLVQDFTTNRYLRCV